MSTFLQPNGDGARSHSAVVDRMTSVANRLARVIGTATCLQDVLAFVGHGDGRFNIFAYCALFPLHSSSILPFLTVHVSQMNQAIVCYSLGGCGMKGYLWVMNIRRYPYSVRFQYDHYIYSRLLVQYMLKRYVSPSDRLISLNTRISTTSDERAT